MDVHPWRSLGGSERIDTWRELHRIKVAQTGYAGLELAGSGGLSAAALIRAHSGRFPLIHLKDMVGEGDRRTYAEVGEGVMDFEPIFQASEAQGVAWYIVEQDVCVRPSLESARLSLQNLRRWGKA
ncbi:MAG: hypothetical protein FJZ90_10730 [Chloroflexi bacterium]|nr:hypothetical protein [Chloroflexota bacterium]